VKEYSAAVEAFARAFDTLNAHIGKGAKPRGEHWSKVIAEQEASGPPFKRVVAPPSFVFSRCYQCAVLRLSEEVYNRSMTTSTGAGGPDEFDRHIVLTSMSALTRAQCAEIMRRVTARKPGPESQGRSGTVSAGLAMLRQAIPFAALLASSLWGQPEQLPAFEVTSVRLTPRESIGFTSTSPYGANRYTATNAALHLLVQLAYEVRFEDISGIEKLGSDHYDIAVKAEDGVMLTYQNLKPRLQRLLAERFKLAVHREQKQVDGYTLVAAKGGPKLHATAGISQPGATYPGGVRIQNAPVAVFAGMLRRPAGRPVIDQTGISGNYDFELRFAREQDQDSALPSFFTALEEQYGLRLQAAKVPLEILVIDRVERVPTEN
jgi:uncharacterized protein (TIGR03435 family)